MNSGRPQDEEGCSLSHPLYLSNQYENPAPGTLSTPRSFPWNQQDRIDIVPHQIDSHMSCS